jgi:transcriptional regulator with XRE-family HTH domain
VRMHVSKVASVTLPKKGKGARIMGQEEQELVIDRYIGTRMRELRRARGLTQSEIADALDVTFQQVQKYEKGVNRVSASKLLLLAQFFGKPITVFFPAETSQSIQDDISSKDLNRASMSRRMMNAYDAIEDQGVRRHLLGLTQALSARRTL